MFSLRLAVLALLCALAAPAASAQSRITWDALARVRMVQQNGRSVPSFDQGVRRLHGQRVTIQGFMLPLEQTPRQQRFLLTAVPMVDCFYCIPGGPESFIEIRAARPAAFTYERVAITGRLEVLTNDPMGMYYRLADAQVAG